MTVFFLAATIVAISGQFLGLGLFIYFCFFLKPRPVTGALPGVTILKPCYRVEDGEQENYEYFFNQDYPGPLQLLFVASSETDPAVALVKQFLAKYPEVDAELVISKTRRAYWAKIDAVYDGQKKAKHDFFIISDSDARVGKDYARLMVSSLQEPGVALVSTPQWDFGADNFASHWKVLANNCDSAVFVLSYYFFSRVKDMALGHSIGFRLSEFRSLSQDPWPFLNRFLAEDLAYGLLFSQAGKKAVLEYFCPVQFAGKTIKQVYSQKVRWLINQRMAAGNRFVYLVGALLYPEVPALFYLIATGFSPSGWWVFAAASATRIGISAVVEKLYLGSLKMSARYFWTVPLWDLSQIYFFIHGFFKDKITYGPKTYRVVDRHFLQEI